MKKCIILLIFVVAYTGCRDSVSVTKLWESEKKLNVPESVLYSPGENILYVSNIYGKPTEKNGLGFIAKLDLDGKIIKQEWVRGLNAPKGMGIHGDTLYVTDISRIALISIKDAKIVRTHDVKGAKFLNDIAIDAKGTVYITDMYTNKIHMLKNGTVSPWLESPAVKSPNGLCMKGDRLLVGVEGAILSVGLKDKNISTEVSLPGHGMVDGLRDTGGGSYIISDWNGKTELVYPDKPGKVLLDTTAQKINAADVEYIPGKNMLLIPTFFDNRVVAYRVKPD
ncbi:MAG: ATP/GTP-binding protein [Spirochaetae bacterium HGW-Spirochaetae-1]|jgi:sugar lactone lactonase YvrE|nr:MAG: ATP/GTP-binding protein [Spirochaetae bacterium HGW-Spirochaetae-1]